MLNSVDWSSSQKLEDQIRRLQNLKNRGGHSPPMDAANSVITQVARDEDHCSNGYVAPMKDHTCGNALRKNPNTKKQKSRLRSVFCCLGIPKRKSKLNGQPAQDSNCNLTLNGKKEHMPPSPTPSPLIVNNNNVQENVFPIPVRAVEEQRYLLPSKSQDHLHKKCAVIDLDETLVHSSFKPISNADFVVPVEIEGTIHQVYVLKRPHVDTYLRRMGEMYECVLFTASLSKYADPVADLLDQHGVFTSRLFRESCVFHRGNYVKDLSLIGRDLDKVIIIDNSPASYIFHPDNAVPVVSWFDDPHDTELLDLLPCFESIANSEDVYTALQLHGFTSRAQEITASIKQQQILQLQLQQQFTDDDDEEER